MSSKTRNFCVYCKNEEINDATFRYIELIRAGLREAGLSDLGITQNKIILRQANFVVTISCLSAMRAIALYPKAKIIHWFQGVEAVERRFLHKGLRGWLRWVLWTLMEYILLYHAQIKLFVSQQMRDFLGDVYRSKNFSLVIPCYNVDLCDISASDPGRYRSINMVYAGSMYSWQCVRDSLEAYKVIRDYQPDVKMTILTRDVECARKICSDMDLKGVKVESVSPEAMLMRLKEFSFGFILRENMIINKVSTPTKFSSYLGAGVIPIMTEATPALATMASDTPFKIIVPTSTASEAIAEGVLKICRMGPTPQDVALSFGTIFQKYFNDALYRRQIADLIKRV